MLGYNVPSYMKKGQINQQQLEFYANRIMSRLEKIVAKEERKHMSRGEKRRLDNAPIEARLQEYRKLRDSVIRSANEIGGLEGDIYRGLVIDGKDYAFDALSSKVGGRKRPELTSIKDLKNYLKNELSSNGRLTQKKMLSYLDSTINQMKDESTFELFTKQAIDSFSKAFDDQIIKSADEHLSQQFVGIDEEAQVSIKDMSESFIQRVSGKYPLAFKYASQEILDFYDERFLYWSSKKDMKPVDAIERAISDVEDYLSTWSLPELKEVKY